MYFKNKLSAALVAVAVAGNGFYYTAYAGENTLDLPGGLSLNPQLANDVLVIPLMHATKFQPDLNVEEYYVSEKLDGVRAVWNGHQLHSRSGRIISAPDWFTKNFPATFLDGELWIERGAFEKVSGIVRTKKAVEPDWKNVKFMLFDLPNSPNSFESRLNRLRHIVKSSNSKFLKIVAQKRLSDSRQLDQLLESVISLNGEGLMLQHQQNLYVPGRSDRVLKLKPFDDAEATILAHLPGKGKYLGMLGAVEVRNAEGKIFRIGSGFSDNERQNPPQIGAIITYRFQGRTVNNIPRFATFMRVRPSE